LLHIACDLGLQNVGESKKFDEVRLIAARLNQLIFKFVNVLKTGFHNWLLLIDGFEVLNLFDVERSLQEVAR